jgi:translation initiation factor 2 subunit 3
MSILNENQPNINIGLIGHVSNGKTSIVASISKKDTKQFKLEKKVGKTVKLGYANAKIWKCDNCSEPECFHSTSSEQYYYSCSCGQDCNMIAHVSFVDSPGHNSLMATMLNGTCITDFTILVESVSN